MEDKHALEIRLLKAQIANLELQNKRGLLREALPSLWAIAFSIVASVVVIMIGDRVVNNAMTRLSEVEKQIRIKNEDVANLTRRYETLSELYSSLAGKAMLYDLGVEFEIGIERIGNLHVVHASTDSPNVKFRCYDTCMNSFVFPGGAPNTSLCNEIKGNCTQDKTKQRCNFGPLFFTQRREEGVWVLAELNGKVVYRYVHIYPR